MQGYFDHAATTLIDPEVAKRVYDAMLEFPGNPSSSHRLGMQAAVMLKKARAGIASLVGASEQEIFFTSGGTEGNNLLLQGAAERMQKKAPQILYSETEHASVSETVAHLGQKGSSPVAIAPQKNGGVDPEGFLSALSDKVGLATFMAINNETGATNPVSSLAKEIKKRQKETLVHTDLVSSLGKMPIHLSTMGVDMATFSGHKIHGPYGVGFVYIKKGLHLRPFLLGGAQMEKVRPGTENLPAVLGLSLALEKAIAAQKKNYDAAKKCREAAIGALSAGLQNPTFRIGESDSPFILNLSTNTVKSETVLNYLSGKGFYISAGSACAKGAQSHVLQAMGLPKKESDTALRLSFSSDNTVEETLLLAKAIIEAEQTLRHAY